MNAMLTEDGFEYDSDTVRESNMIFNLKNEKIVFEKKSYQLIFNLLIYIKYMVLNSNHKLI